MPITPPRHPKQREGSLSVRSTTSGEDLRVAQDDVEEGARLVALTPSALTTDAVTTYEALEALRDEWWALWHQARHATPFQTPAWVLGWWRHFGWEGLWCLVLRSGGRLVGFVPLFIWKRPDTGEHTVLIVGTGITDYLDGLFAPGFEEAGTDAVLDFLAAERARWDVLDFQQLNATSPLLRGKMGGDWSDEVTPQDACPVLDFPLDAAPTDWLPRRLRKNMMYYRRRAERLGPVRIEAATDETFDKLFDGLLRLHEARWANRGEAGVLAEEKIRSFHREFARELLTHGLLRLYGYRIGSQLAACLYGIAAKGWTYYYLSGFDPELGALSLGTQIVGHAICEAAREGHAAFDFLRGQEDYKYAWGATDHPTHRRIMRAM